MNKILIQNPRIINEGRSLSARCWWRDKMAVFEGGSRNVRAGQTSDRHYGKWLIPGVIDDQVHFRDPGTHIKGISGPSRAAWPVLAVTTTWTCTEHDHRPRQSPIWNGNSTVPPRSPVRITPSSSVGQTIIWTRSQGWIVADIVPDWALFLGSSTGNMLVDKKRLVGAYLRQTRYADRHPARRKRRWSA